MWSQVIETLSSDPAILLGAILGTLGILSVTSICITAIVSESCARFDRSKTTMPSSSRCSIAACRPMRSRPSSRLRRKTRLVLVQRLAGGVKCRS